MTVIKIAVMVVDRDLEFRARAGKDKLREVRRRALLKFATLSCGFPRNVTKILREIFRSGGEISLNAGA